MSARSFTIRGGRVIIGALDGKAPNKLVGVGPSYVCPYCGSTQVVLARYTGEEYERVHCFACRKVIGFSHAMMQPCPTCGKVSKVWEERPDGKVTANCCVCGHFEAYPD